jgi:hypothetical protein
MIIIACLIGAVVFGTLGGLFVKEPGTAEGELAMLAWGLTGVIVGIVAFTQLGLI